MIYSPLPPIRVLFSLKDAVGLTRHQQYATLTALCSPMLKTHGIYEPAFWISNPKRIDRAAIFWLVALPIIAKRLQAVAPAEVDCTVWQQRICNVVKNGRRDSTVQEVEF